MATAGHRWQATAPCHPPAPGKGVLRPGGESPSPPSCFPWYPDFSLRKDVPCPTRRHREARAFRMGDGETQGHRGREACSEHMKSVSSQKEYTALLWPNNSIHKTTFDLYNNLRTSSPTPQSVGNNMPPTQLWLHYRTSPNK